MSKWVGGAVVLVSHEMLARSLGVVPNYGVSFGIDFGYWAIMIATMAILGWCWKNKYYVLAIGGGVNWLDRLRFGYVRDYWQVPIIGVYNNLADWLIVLGLILVGLRVWRKWK